MIRWWVFNVASLLSPLCVASAAWWIRSYHAFDVVDIGQKDFVIAESQGRWLIATGYYSESTRWVNRYERVAVERLGMVETLP